MDANKALGQQKFSEFLHMNRTKYVNSSMKRYIYINKSKLTTRGNAGTLTFST
jgi:hypothetical protein